MRRSLVTVLSFVLALSISVGYMSPARAASDPTDATLHSLDLESSDGNVSGSQLDPLFDPSRTHYSWMISTYDRNNPKIQLTATADSAATVL